MPFAFSAAGPAPALMLALLFASSRLVAETTPEKNQPRADKTIYSLSNPTPASLLREMSTDRPDATESPFTIDAGRAQLESDFLSYTRNRLDGVRTREW